jgi:cellulose synthase/poly-beta-1,6-N-acetylglucosamine synthase-like glycosyltransferase
MIHAGFEVVSLFLLVVCGGAVSYLLILSVASLFASQEGSNDKPEKSFAVVIPAHNEELVLESAIDSVQCVDYPRGLYDLIVVADNCTDRTADIARTLDAAVYERHDLHNRGKGYALNWVIKRLCSGEGRKRYDAFVFIDADTLMAPNFLLEMNTKLKGGERVIQARYSVLDPGASWQTSLRNLGLTMGGFIKPLGKSYLGLPVGLLGNGMCFTKEVICSMGWPAFSLTEDREYSLELLCQGIPIAFAPQAVVYAQMPVSSRQALIQDLRHERGRLELAWHYGPKLFLQGIQRRRLSLLVSPIELLIPPTSLLVGVSFLFLALNASFWLWTGRSAQTLVLLLAWLGVVLGQGFYLFIGLLSVPAQFRTCLALLYAPVYMAWKLRAYIQAIFGVNAGRWVRTERTPVRTQTDGNRGAGTDY